MSAPIQLVEQQSNDSNSHAKLKQAQKSMEFDLADAECLQRFLKIKVGGHFIRVLFIGRSSSSGKTSHRKRWNSDGNLVGNAQLLDVRPRAVTSAGQGKRDGSLRHVFLH